MKSVKPRASQSVGSVPNRSKSGAAARFAQLENLVDELIKEVPQEERIKAFMNAAGLTYSPDPIARMNDVLEALEGARATHKKGGEHGRDL